MSVDNSKALQWFRWHHGTYNDPKWMTVASRANTALAAKSRDVTQDHAPSRKVTVGHVVSVWAAMMEHASMANPRGELDGWDDEDVAAFLGYEPGEVEAIRLAMQGKTLDGNKLSAWPKRQPKREDPGASARQAAKRDREKAAVTDRDKEPRHEESRNVTQCHPREEESREEKKDQEQIGSLRSPSSSATPTTADGNVVSLNKAEQRLASITADAMASYNAILAKPNGLLSAVTEQGIETKRAWVKRCVRPASQICRRMYGSERVTRQFWDDYFRACLADDHKSGRTGGGRGHETWVPDFEYLTRPMTMIKIFDNAAGAGEA